MDRVDAHTPAILGLIPAGDGYFVQKFLSDFVICISPACLGEHDNQSVVAVMIDNDLRYS